MKRNQTPLMDSIAVAPAVLYLAFELGATRWHLLFGNGQRRRSRVIEARSLPQLWQEIDLAKVKLKLPEEVLVVSCYEAGRDGHWLHRALIARGILNLEVASTSIKVSQQGKHRKTDRLDVQALWNQLYHYCQGEREALQVVNVPSREDEDQMRLDRELSKLKQERTRHTNRLSSTLIRFGLHLRRLGGDEWVQTVASLRDATGEPLGPQTQRALIREHARLLLVQQQIQALEAERDQQIAEGKSAKLAQVRQLMLLRGVGPVIGWSLVMELFGWRAFRNRRQLGAATGLVGTPFQSGAIRREQGLSKTGNARIRALSIELAWLWLQFQPDSKWSCWYQQRFAQGNKRLRKIGVVAVARHVLIDLWRYLEHGVLPAGAVLKTA